MTPRISVIMAVYNGGSFLKPAIESILRQSESRFEFLIIDDGSQDGSAAIIESFKDPRIRLIRNAANRGLAASLNAGLEVARGTYIARLDADDIALPDRLALQLDFLERNPDIAAIAKDTARLGDWAMTRKALGEISSSNVRDDATSESARLLARFGRRAEALDLAKTINSSAKRDAALRELAE